MLITRLQVESWAPLTLAVVVSVTWYFLGGSISSEIAKELLSAVISSASVGGGFLTTSLSILISLGNTAVGRQIKRRRKLEALYSYIRHAIYSCLCLVVICVIAFFSFDKENGIGVDVSTIIVFISVYSIVSMARIVEILVRIFSMMSEESNNLNG